MTKIANRPLLIPERVKVVVEKGKIIAHGPQGKDELSINPEVEIVYQENKIFTKSNNFVLSGTFNSLIYNLIKGVEQGYKEIVEVKGINYKVNLKNEKLELALGKSHLDYVEIPVELKIEVVGNKIIIMGTDKQKVRQFARNLQVLRRPSIYKKDKGIYLASEEKNIQLRSRKNLKK
jgi:large subunit ribosomal protein L6